MPSAHSALQPEPKLSFSLFPSNLRFLRKRRGLNQEDISSLFHKKPNTVGNWENGKSEPSIPELLIISGYFGVNLEDLLRSELRQRQADDERQLTLWPEAGGQPNLPAQHAVPPRMDVPATTPGLEVHINSVLPILAEHSNPAGPAFPGEEPSGANLVKREAAAAAGGDALWFMLRELRTLQERMDQLQAAFNQSRGHRPADKSDH